VLTGTAGVASSRRSYACRVLPALGEFHTSVQWLCVVRIAKLSVFPGDEHPVPSSKPLAVIDDDRSVREAIVALLRSHGHATEGFDSADQFIQSFQPGKFACIVSDVQMPGMSGIELVHWLADRDIDLPVVLMTAQADEHVASMFFNAKAVLRKPFTCEALADILHALV